MFDYSKEEKKEKLHNKILLIIIFGALCIIVGVTLLDSAFAVNVTAIDEIKADLEPQLDHGASFSIFWIIFLLIILSVFMTVAFVKREEREMVFFSIGAVIVSFMITFLFISPVSFGYEVDDRTLQIEEIEWIDGTITYNAGVTNNSKFIPVIPDDKDFRMSLSLLFTGISLFNGLYAILILTQFSTKAKGGNNFK